MTDDEIEKARLRESLTPPAAVPESVEIGIGSGFDLHEFQTVADLLRDYDKAAQRGDVAIPISALDDAADFVEEQARELAKLRRQLRGWPT